MGEEGRVFLGKAEAEWRLLPKNNETVYTTFISH